MPLSLFPSIPYVYSRNHTGVGLLILKLSNFKVIVVLCGNELV